MHKDLSGRRFGRLVAIRDVGSVRNRRIWECKCDCGNYTNVPATSLITGGTKSCGCLQQQTRVDSNVKHGFCGTRLYRIWKGMKSRCLYPSSTDYKWYGARGISVCREWEKFEPFAEWALSNGYSDDLTLDRIDNDGDYTPCNCRWATISEQNKNKRRSCANKNGG